MSNDVTRPFLSSRNSLSSRATRVLPTWGRGEATMKTGVAGITRYIRRNRRSIQPNYFGRPKLFFAAANGWFAGADDVGQLDAVVLAPDIGEPVPDIASQYERIVGGLVMDALVGDEFEEGDGGDLDLFEGHFVEFRDGQLGRILDAVEIGVVGRMVPLEEARIVDEILHQEIFCTGHEIRGFRDLVERGDRRAQDMEDGKSNLAGFGRFEKADVAQRDERRRQQAGADVDHGNRRDHRIERI